MARPAATSLVVLAVALVARPAGAQDGILAGLQKGLDSVFSVVSTTTTSASGTVARTETINVSPALTLNLSTLVYPGLRLTAGGVFEVNLFSTRTGGSDTRSTITRARPFFLLRSTDPVFSPGFGYFRREERSRTAGQSDVKLVNDEYAAYLGWNPSGGPRSDIQFLRTHTFDGELAFQDVVRNFGSVVSNYTYRGIGAYYRGSLLDSNDRLQRMATRQRSHAGRLSHSGSAVGKRLLWNATYNVNYQSLRTDAGAKGGEVALPLTPFAGLSVVSDTPLTAQLGQNPALIDSNLTAGAGLNLGLPASPAPSRGQNIGIDFLNPTEVNRLLIWVDRELTAPVAASFSWEVYSSTDNLVWRREATIPTAPFGPFENRFQIDFPAITTRYVKVVTAPLSVVVQDASRYPEIFVTEIQAVLRRQATDLSTRVTQTTHLVNADVRMRLLDAPSLYYEGSFLLNGPDRLGRTSDTLSNGVSVNHAFGRMVSLYARGAREQGRQSQGDRVATLTNATLTLQPVPTIRTSFLYTSQDERVAGAANDRRAFIVQNSAQVYRGVDVLVGFGWNAATRESGEVSHDRLANVSATIVPRQRLSFTLSYDGRLTERSGRFVGDPRTSSQRLYASVAFDPLRTVRLVVAEEVFAVTGQQTRTTTDIGVNWSPFQDGTLQFIFASNAALRALEFGRDRSTLGTIRWNVSPRSYIDVSYQRTRMEQIFQTTESNVFSVRVRLFS